MAGSVIVDEDRLQRVMDVLVEVFPDCALVLVVAPAGSVFGHRLTYGGNGTIEETRALLKTMVERWEGPQFRARLNLR